MTNVLHDICEAKREHIKARRQAVSESSLLEQVKQASPVRAFKKALEAKLSREPFALITEIKKASPSGGLIREDFDPAALAKAYASAGSACLSVLTDAPYFQGDDDYLRQAREATPLPCLRKDFMLDPYQIIESRALGADCILLIMAALENRQAQELEKSAQELGMDILVEVHDKAELDRAFTHLSSTLIGINNRDLKTLVTNLATSETLAKDLPGSILPVCESGIRTHDDLQRMKQAGLSCFLVGESLMREADVARATRLLLGNAS